MGAVEVCGRRLKEWMLAGWGFVTLGVALTTTAFLLGIVYFSIRAITTSLEHVDIVPTYATALLLCCVGILTMFLYKRRDTIIAVPTMVLNFICLLLALASFVLLLTKVIRVMKNFRSCNYEELTMQCHCYTAHDGHGLSETVYNNALNCSLIEGNLLKLAYAQSALFLLASILGVLTTVLTAYITYNERKVDYLLEDDEEPFEQDFETLGLRADNLTDPLIGYGQYRQIMSRQITLPDFDFRCEHHLSRAFQPGGTTIAGSLCGGVDDRSTGGNQPPCEATTGNDVTRGVSDLGRGLTSSGVAEHLQASSDTRPTTSGNPIILWDGFFRPQEVGSPVDADPRPTGSGLASRPVCRSESDGGQWSLRSMLYPMDPSSASGIPRPQRGRRRRRSRERPRSRSRRRHERHQPYVAFIPVPYSMYRPSSLLGLGISPFPMDPPPPYSAPGTEPPSYVTSSPAPPYTSRPTSRNTSRPVTPDRRQHNNDHCENTGSQNEGNDIVFQTRI